MILGLGIALLGVSMLLATLSLAWRSYWMAGALCLGLILVYTGVIDLVLHLHTSIL